MTQSDQEVEPSEWLTVKEVSAITQYSAKTIYAALWAGELNSSQRGSRGVHRIPRSEVKAWMARLEKGRPKEHAS